MTFDEFWRDYKLSPFCVFYLYDIRNYGKTEEGAGVGGDNKKAADDERLAKGLR